MKLASSRISHMYVLSRDYNYATQFGANKEMIFFFRLFTATIFVVVVVLHRAGAANFYTNRNILNANL